MDQIPVVWKSYNSEAIPRGYWDQGILEDLFNRQGPLAFRHMEDFEKDMDGAVVVINGRMHDKYINALMHDLNKIRWVIVIVTGDEEAVFPFEQIHHPLLRIWIQLPRMNRHNDVSYKLPNGARAGTREILKEIGDNTRDLNFMFVGQINHPRRQQCLEAVTALPESLQHNRVVQGTNGFGVEYYSQREYLEKMTRSKIVLCPSGIETPDTFRLYEALEAGCVPIVDAFASNNQDWGFWQYLFKQGVPFPIIPYWSDLPELLPELLRDYPHNANKVSAWWQNVKRDMHNKLIYDIKDISR